MLLLRFVWSLTSSRLQVFFNKVKLFINYLLIGWLDIRKLRGSWAFTVSFPGSPRRFSMRRAVKCITRDGKIQHPVIFVFLVAHIKEFRNKTPPREVKQQKGGNWIYRRVKENNCFYQRFIHFSSSELLH